MKSIAVQSFLSTGLDPSHGRIQSIQIDDAPLGQGGFGIVFRMRGINNGPNPPQVVKILLDHGQDIAHRGLGTIRELQRRLQLKNAELRANSRSLMVQFPALQGIPQLSFEGSMDGRGVCGYTASDLTASGMEDFGRILESDDKTHQFQAVPLPAKMRMASQLVDAFQFLSSQILFIHADIKAEALFVNLNKHTCAIIDFDSGALARDPNDRPATFGTRQDWLAPEITKQLDQSGNSARAIKVDLLSDIWSVNIAVHYLLFGFHPLFFMNEISERSIDAYFKAFRWPDANPNFVYFRKEYAAHYKQYAAFLKTKLPQEVVDRFAFTINRGYFDPGARTTYGQWKTVLNVVNRPAIKYFRADRTCVTDIRPVRLNWETTGAAKLEIPGIGDVTNRTWIDVPIQRDTLFTLVLTPDLGPPVRKELRVEVSKEPPRIEYFSTSSACVREGAEVEIRWKVHGASQVHISPVLGSLPLEGRAKVRVGGECTLTLTARSPFGASATKVLALAVVRLSPLQPAPAGKASAPATRLDPHRIVQLTAIRP